MGTSRARRRLVSSVAAVLFAVTLVTFSVRADDTDAVKAAGTADSGWPEDLGRACREAGTRPVRDFHAGDAEVMAQATGDHAAVVLFRARDDHHVAVCHGLRDADTGADFVTALFPLRDAPRGATVPPFDTYDVEGVTAVVVGDRLPAGAVRVVMWLGDGRKVSLEPQNGRWLAAVLELAASSGGDPVQRFRYMSADGEVLGEWVAPGVQRNPRVPPIRDTPGLDTRESACLTC